MPISLKCERRRERYRLIGCGFMLLKIFAALRDEDPGKWVDKTFKGTSGWNRRFIKRKNVIVRKRKNVLFGLRDFSNNQKG
jgi:hypothetical protein